VGDFRKRVIRSKDDAFHADCIKRTVKFPKGVMIWGISAKGLGNFEFIDGIVNAEKYQKILTNGLLPSINKLHAEENSIFQQDGASCHTANSTQKWLSEKGITVLSWPSSSPDLNIIKTLWHKMKLRNNPQRTIPDLKSKLADIWTKFTPEFCKSLATTMPARIAAVVGAKGDVTPY
jgi:hypothetical protein